MHVAKYSAHAEQYFFHDVKISNYMLKWFSSVDDLQISFSETILIIYPESNHFQTCLAQYSKAQRLWGRYKHWTGLLE